MIYLITGVMASGKSTVAELLAERFAKSVHLRGDIFRKMVVCGREEMSETPTPEALAQLDLRYRLTAQAAKQYHRAGFTVVVQDNYYGEKLPYILDLLSPEQVQTIVLCPSIDTIAQREAGRKKTGYHGFSVEALYQSFMRETPRIGLWIDNSHQQPDETVSEILSAGKEEYGGNDMVREDNTMRPKEIVNQWVDAFNAADVEALMALYDENAVNHQVANEPVVGKKAIEEMFKGEFATAEMVTIVENIFEDGQWAILEWRDPLGLRGCGFFHVVNGKIIFQRGYWDKLTFLRMHNLPIE